MNTQLGIHKETDEHRSPVRQNNPKTSEVSKASMGSIPRENRRLAEQRRAISKQWDDYMTGRRKEQPATITGHETWKANLRSKPPR